MRRHAGWTLALAVVALAACQPKLTEKADTPAAVAPEAPEPQLMDPRAFTAADSETQSTIGALAVQETVHPPLTDIKTGQPLGVARSTYTFRTEIGHDVATDEDGVADVASTVTDGDATVSLAEALDLTSDAQIRRFKVTGEGADDAPRMCGIKPVAYILLWEKGDAANPLAKLAAVSGAAPGEPGATLCAKGVFKGGGVG